MKNIRNILDLKHKKSIRLGLLLISTLLIISASALVYATMIYEKALDVGNTGGVTTASGSAASAEVTLIPAAIVMLAVAAVVVGLGVFGLLREASRHVSNVPGGQGSSPTGPVSMSPDLPLHLPSTQGEVWEESPSKEESEG
jgi:hypothetical protein